MIWYMRKNYELDYEAKRIIEESKNAGFDIEVVAPNDFDLVVTRDDRKSITFKGEKVDSPDIVLPRTGSGTDYYTQSVLRHLERMHVPILNNAESIEAAKDKMYSTQILGQHNIPVPETMLVRFPVDTNFVKRNIGFPCVIKVLSGSYGKGIHLIRDEFALEELMDFVSSLNSPLNILIQKYIDFAPGVDVRVLVVGGKVLGGMKRIAVDGDFRANISRGGSGERFDIDEQAGYIASESAKLLNLDIAGVDLLIDEDGYKVCEVNSAPGFKGFEEYCNANIAKEIVSYAIFKSNKN